MAIAPVAPEVGGFAGLLIGFLALCGAIVAFGMVKILYHVTVAVGGAVGWIAGHIPYVEGIISSPVNDVFHWMEHVMSEVALGLQGSIAFWWHQLGDLTHWLGREIEAQAHLVWMLATHTIPHAAIDALNTDIRLIREAAHALSHSADVTLRRVLVLDHSLSRRIAAGVHDVIRPWEHAIDVTIPRDIAALRERTHSILSQLDRLWARVHGLDKLLGTAAFAAAVATALSYLGLGWLRCRNVGKLGRGICGIPSTLLDALLLGAIDVLVVTDLCDLSYLMTAAAEQIEPLLLDFVDVEEALIGCHGNTAPPALRVPTLDLPSVTGQLALAA